MKSKYTFLFIYTLIIVFLFYRVDSVVAMAVQQNTESTEEPDDESAGEPETEPGGESAGEPETEPGSEPAGGPETEPGSESAGEPETEPGSESVGGPETEPGSESAGGPETEPGSESARGPETEPGSESAREPESEAAAERQAVQSTESIVWQEPEERVSTGPDLIEWLESHKNTGGAVRLTDHVTLDGVHSICPAGVNMPAVFVDAGQYTITITGEIEVLSDGNLTFSGQPDGKGLFYVAEKGMLSLQGITVESGQCALWQEEGAGLILSDCRVSGRIHYAEKPFIVDQDPVCVVVEKGRTLDEVLPAQLDCTVNRQGEVTHNEPVPLSWNLEGTERQQEKRRRFRMQGSFLYAASSKPVLGTVVYNDYPLTFTDVNAAGDGTWYIFRGGYTRPEHALPIKVMSEYSFDAENWRMYEEMSVKDTYTGFSIVIPSEEAGRAVHPNIYIRLRWNDNGTGRFSNVLCYAADNLECAEDIGGSRGGGTSIINPPDEPDAPQESMGGTFSEEEETAQEADRNADAGDVQSEIPADTDQSQKESVSADLPADGGTAGAVRSGADVLHVRQGRTSDAEPANTQAQQSLYTAAKADHGEVANGGDSDIPEKAGVVAARSAYGENGADVFKMSGQIRGTDARHVRDILIAAGFVLLSVSAGIVGFYVHSQSGTNR